MGENARPLQTLIWYPSLESSGEPMRVGDYVRLADTEIHFNAPDEKENRWRSLLKASFDIPLRAVQEAKPAKGHYPVLIYAPSDSSVSWENADLCEYLASHGYVVLASPSMGVATRDMTDDLDGINAQARDISFLITYARSLPDTDLSEVAMVSWSWGGIQPVCLSTRPSHRCPGGDGRQHALLFRPREKSRGHSSRANDHTASLFYSECES